MTLDRARTLLVLRLIATLALVACGDNNSPPQPLSFTPSVKVGGLCCLLYNPQIAIAGDRIFVAWDEAIRYTTYIPFYRSNDGGSSFPTSSPSSMSILGSVIDAPCVWSQPTIL